MPTTRNEETAHQLGQVAFANDKPCIPAKDDALMTMIRTTNKFGEGATLCKAWQAGWTTANLKTPV